MDGVVDLTRNSMVGDNDSEGPPPLMVVWASELEDSDSDTKH